MGLALALALAAPALAQTTRPAAPAAPPSAKGGSSGSEMNNGDISFGYNYSQVRVGGVETTYSSGWSFEAAKRVARGISLVAIFGGMNGPTVSNVDQRVAQQPARFLNYAGGVRFSTQNDVKVRPFAEFVYGGANDNATLMNHMSVMIISGGVDLKLSKHVGIRVSGGAPFWFFFGPVQKGAQFGIGVVVPFSK
jgi:hypothetical protein